MPLSGPTPIALDRAERLAARLGCLEWQSGGNGIYAMLQEWPAEFEADGVILWILRQFYPEGRRGMTMLSRLVPGQEIPEHTDRHEHCHRRVHFPITTNDKATFTSDGREFHMERGGVYEIDPFLPHSARNHGDTDRIHLIFNVLEAP